MYEMLNIEASGNISFDNEAEDVKGRGGSGYVIQKDNRVLEEWFHSH